MPRRVNSQAITSHSSASAFGHLAFSSAVGIRSILSANCPNCSWSSANRSRLSIGSSSSLEHGNQTSDTIQIPLLLLSAHLWSGKQGINRLWPGWQVMQQVFGRWPPLDISHHPHERGTNTLGIQLLLPRNWGCP